MMRVELPLDEKVIDELRAGCEVELDGVLYSARDQAHRKLFEAIEAGHSLPFDLKNQVIYYMGPAPTPKGRVIGACGPTTASRMDRFTPALLVHGLRGMVGKGPRSAEVRDAIVRNRGVYFYAFGGCGALYAEKVKHCELVAYPELGPEAVYRLTVARFPAIVAIDARGESIFSPMS